MAKRRKQTPQRTHVYQRGDVRPGFSRRQAPQTAKSGPSTTTIALAVAGGIAVLAVLAYAFGFFGGGPAASPTPSPRPTAEPRPSFDVHAPTATPLASPPASPSGDGTTATISTDLGDIVFEIYNQSAPVASQNFENLADAGFYDGIGFHRVVPDFMIQGGDPLGSGGGGPGYTIPDEPVVGEYKRGIVAMARTGAPNSAGSQFFIMVADTPSLNGGGYVIFGNVIEGMDVVDAIVNGPTANDEQSGVGGTALQPVVMNTVIIDRP